MCDTSFVICRSYVSAPSGLSTCRLVYFFNQWFLIGYNLSIILQHLSVSYRHTRGHAINSAVINDRRYPWQIMSCALKGLNAHTAFRLDKDDYFFGYRKRICLPLNEVICMSIFTR